MVSHFPHLSVNRSALCVLRSTDRSWLNLHLKPLVHWPWRKYSHTMDLGSTPGGEFQNDVINNIQTLPEA